jgi:hypothetical protein
MSLMRAVLRTLSGPVVVDNEGDAFTYHQHTQRELKHLAFCRVTRCQMGIAEVSSSGCMV